VTAPGSGDPAHRRAHETSADLPGGVAALPPPGIHFSDNSGRLLLSLRIEGGRVVADYRPEDLDAAARLLVANVVRIRVSAEHDPTPARFDGERAGDIHRQVLAALDRVATTAVDAGGLTPAGLWRPDVLESGVGVFDGEEQLVFADQGDAVQVQHAATWCPARMLTLLTGRRAHLVAHAPDGGGRCTSCLSVPGWAGARYQWAPPWPCEPYRSHLAGLPDLPQEITHAVDHHP